MPAPAFTAGPRLADIGAQPEAPESPQPQGAATGGALPPTAAEAAALTSPVQQARVAALMAKERLKRVALELKAANAF